MPEKKKEFPKESHMVWQPKAKAASKSSQQVHPAKQSDYEEVQRTKERICLRALDLQLKLFGFSSVLLPSKKWLEMVRTQQGYLKLASVPIPSTRRKPMNAPSINQL